ncbi:MAG: class I SAM-dependent methyltransferase [Pseudomonadota bacterium]
MTTKADYKSLDLQGVPETMLWPLWNRAAEMRRKNRLIDDPISAELVERIDYDFRRNFGSPSVLHAIRARYSDDLVRKYIKNCKGRPTVIGLGDGIDTQAWRIDDPSVQWVSVDVPQAIKVRRNLLPKHANAMLIESSALSPSWFSEVSVEAPPFVSAAGLMMYFEEREVACLLAMIADWFPDATVFFDTIPPIFSRKTMRGYKLTKHYTAPPMPWGVEVDEVASFINQVPGIRSVSAKTYAEPYPDRLRIYHWLSRFRSFRRLAPGLVLAKAYRKTAEGYT